MKKSQGRSRNILTEYLEQQADEEGEDFDEVKREVDSDSDDEGVGCVPSADLLTATDITLSNGITIDQDTVEELVPHRLVGASCQHGDWRSAAEVSSASKATAGSEEFVCGHLC